MNYRVESDTPFTVKVNTITLPNFMDKLRAESVWGIHIPDESKFQKYFDAKLDKGTGVIYGGDTNDTYINNASLDG